MSLNKVIGVVAIRYRVMPATHSMRMSLSRNVGRIPHGRIGVHGDNMFIAISVRMVQQTPVVDLDQVACFVTLYSIYP